MRGFSQVDVFASELTLGNPVAVVHDADDLDDEQMAGFARWTNLSETTFLLRPSTPDADYRVRIFTTARELPFAGHPTLGSARAWLAAGGRPRRDDELVQECAAGLVRVRVDGDRLAFAAPPLLRDGPIDPGELAEVVAALGLDPARVVDATWADNGPGWAALLLDSARTVLALDPDPARFGVIDKVGVVGPHPDGSDAAFEVRAFVPGSIGEDPVTGSLNASIGQWLTSTGRAPASYVAAQGTRLQRRGRVHVDRTDDDVWVGGQATVGVTGSVAL
ncbi:PhzF family phenazine biosynthesis protein [Aeromicrobium stalagmiti]|uniref:PhzF family phenazine biosynthesis protein n=1 Tax=Aeromicrobium stalagmiti TaxID=2738988 RepID=UPI001569DF70|nr:PhzF family phenazine biosynthesis protein [Aeromicrobium stalagmiti]NRQ50005.1 PhzF family phenazine biosynthesis protein [Aeromicrobium stalagmiti]